MAFRLSSNLAFGKAGMGFTVTPTATASSTPASGSRNGHREIAGNQVVGLEIGNANNDHGIRTVVDDGEPILIDQNQVTGWETDIDLPGVGKTAPESLVTFNTFGIVSGSGLFLAIRFTGLVTKNASSETIRPATGDATCDPNFERDRREAAAVAVSAAFRRPLVAEDQESGLQPGARIATSYSSDAAAAGSLRDPWPRVPTQLK